MYAVDDAGIIPIFLTLRDSISFVTFQNMLKVHLKYGFDVMKVIQKTPNLFEDEKDETEIEKLFG